MLVLFVVPLYDALYVDAIHLPPVPVEPEPRKTTAHKLHSDHTVLRHHCGAQQLHVPRLHVVLRLSTLELTPCMSDDACDVLEG